MLKLKLRELKKILFVLIFVSSTFSVYSQNPSQTVSINKLKNLKLDTLKILKLLELGKVYEKQIPDSALYYYNIALLISQNNNKSNYVALCYKNIGKVFHFKNEYKIALDYYNKSLNLFEKLQIKTEIADCYSYIGIIYKNQGIYEKAIISLLKSLKISESIEYKYGIAISYYNLAEIQNIQGGYNKALNFLFKSLKIYEELKDNNKMAACLNFAGTVYRELVLYDKAMEYHLKALKIYEELGNKNGISQSYNGIAAIYYYEGESSSNNIAIEKYKKAKESILKSFKINEELNNKKGMSSSLTNIATLNLKLKDFNAAITAASKGLLIASEIGSLELKKNNYETIAEAYYGLKDFKNAFDNYKLFKKLNDSIFNKEKSSQIQNALIKFQSEKKEQELTIQKQENELLKNKNRIAKTNRNILYIVLFFIILITFGVILSLRYRIKKNIQINTAEKELVNIKLKEAENERKLIEVELENKKNEIEYKNKELVNFALNIVEKNEFLEELKLTISRSFESKNMKDIISEIDKNLNLDKDKQEFQANVENLYQSFFLILKEKFPTLSKSEERLCSLLRLNLTSKDIALLLNISPSSVDVNRYRLRKKLNISEEVILSDFLNSI